MNTYLEIPEAADENSSSSLLRAVGLRRNFGGVVAVAGVDLQVRRGEIVGVIGPNGSGKSTTLNMLAGTIRPSAGEIRLGDRDVTFAPPAARVKRGLVRMFQQSRIFGSLSLEENLRITARRISTVEAAHYLSLVGLELRARERADTLSYGQQRLLELARAMSLQPSVLLLDEPTAGVHTSIVARIEEILVNLSAGGMGLLIVEHNVEFVAGVAHRLLGMSEGSIISSGTPAAVLRDELLLASYYGA